MPPMIVLLLLILLVLAVTPYWSYSRSWGYAPSGGLVVTILVILLILYALGYRI